MPLLSCIQDDTMASCKTQMQNASQDGTCFLCFYVVSFMHFVFLKVLHHPMEMLSNLFSLLRLSGFGYIVSWCTVLSSTCLFSCLLNTFFISKSNKKYYFNFRNYKWWFLYDDL